MALVGSIQADDVCVFRPAVPSDAAVLCSLIRLLAAHEGRAEAATVTEENLQDLLFSSNAVAQAFIVEKSAVTVGYAIVVLKISSFSGQRILYIEDVYVDSSVRGAGIGQFTMHKLAEYALKLKCKSLEWSAVTGNSSARNFYKKLGADLVTGHVHYTMQSSDIVGQ